MGPPTATAMEIGSGAAGGEREAEVVAAFAEINEDLREKQDILDKCECVLGFLDSWLHLPKSPVARDPRVPSCLAPTSSHPP